MPIDTKRLAKKREQVKKSQKLKEGGDLWRIDPGEYLLYLHGLTYPDDDNPLTAGYNFVEVVQHYGVGGKQGGQMCIDTDTNPVLLHPTVQQFMASRKKNPIEITEDTKCPIDLAIENGDLDEKDATRQKPEAKWLFGVTPMFYRQEKGDEWTKLRFDPKVMIAGVTIFNDITAVMIDMSPHDITDPENAVLLHLTRVGKSFGETEYSVVADVKTIRKPMKLDKGQRRIIAEATKPGGACDLFRLVANLTKSENALKALMTGVETETNKPELVDNPEDAERKECFGIDYADDDEECKDCDDVDRCRDIVKGEDSGEEESPTKEQEPEDQEEPDVDDDSADDGEEEPPPDCWGQWEEGDEGCAECSLQSDCEADTKANEAPSEDESPDDDSDPDDDEEDEELKKLEEEAKRLASKKRSTKKSTGKKTGSRKRK
jgi:hypothetical protein